MILENLNFLLEKFLLKEAGHPLGICCTSVTHFSLLIIIMMMTVFDKSIFSCYELNLLLKMKKVLKSIKSV